MEEFALTPEEINYFMSIQSDERWLQSEYEKLDLRKQNLFLRISLRTKHDNLVGWGIDLKRSMCVPPQGLSSES